MDCKLNYANMNVRLLCYLWIISIVWITINAEYASKRGNTAAIRQRVRQSVNQNIPQQRELSDVQLIKYIARNTNRHGNKQRPRRRPNPVYGPPAYKQGTPLGPPQTPLKSNYGPPKHANKEQDRLPELVSYFPSNDYDASQIQHHSFAEPPTPAPRPPYGPVDEDESSLPIQPDAASYRLPPSTSYGVPVAPISNVYPDKNEYLKKNQPQAPLYNPFDSVPSLAPPTFYQPPLPNPPALFNFAEPTFNSSVHIAYNHEPGYFAAKDPYAPLGAIGEISEDGQLGSDEDDDFGPAASSVYAHAKPPAYRHRFRAPSDQYVDDLLVLPKEPIGSSSSNVNAQFSSPFTNNFSHNLDTADLRELYSAGSEQPPTKKRTKSKRRKHPNRDATNHSEFGTRIGLATQTKTTTTDKTPLNFVLLSATNRKPDLDESVEDAAQSITADAEKAQKHKLFTRLSRYRKTHYNGGGKNESTASLLYPRHRDSYADDEPLEITTSPTSLALGQTLAGQHFEIMSIDQSHSHSFYAGTVAPADALHDDDKGAAEQTRILSDRILSDVIAHL